MSIEKRIEKLEKSTPREGGLEMRIKYLDGNVTRFRRGEGPPWETIIINPVDEMNEEQRKRFDKMMLFLFNGKHPGEIRKEGARDDTKTENWGARAAHWGW